jgi:ribosome-associated toxin RatA of RatAB toxin-antitoxin module
VRSELAIDVAAPAALVFALARDVTRWPALLPHYASVTVTARDERVVVARFVARRPLVGILGLALPVAWRSRTWSEPDTMGLRFVHLGGATKGMDVTWDLAPTATGCHVTIRHDFRPRIPGWAWLMDRGFVRPIASRTLASFKAIAEATATATAAAEGER